MAYDEGLAERLRDALRSQRNVTEKKMFGGLAFMSHDHMFVGIVGDELMARVGKDYYDKALSLPFVREMDFTGKPMQGYVFVGSQGFEEDAELADWIKHCLAFVHSLPAKKK